MMPSLLHSSTVQRQWLNAALLNVVPVQYQAINSLTTPENSVALTVNANYHLVTGHYLLVQSAQNDIALLQVQQVTRHPEHEALASVTAHWVVGEIQPSAVIAIQWVAGNTLLQAGLSTTETIALSDTTTTTTETRLPCEALLGTTLLQSTDKATLTETIVTLLMHWRTVGKFPIVLDLLGVFRQLALPNIALAQLGEQGSTFCSIDAYGLDALMTDCITQLPVPLQGEAWQQYATALARVTQPVEDIHTLLALLERAGAGLLHRQVQRLPQLGLFAKQPQARYFSVATWLQQFPTAALWVIDLSALPLPALPAVLQLLINEMTPLALGKDHLALALLAGEQHSQAVVNVQPTAQATMPFLQGQWQKRIQTLSTQTTVSQSYDLAIQLQPTEGIVVVQGTTTTHGIAIMCGLPTITTEASTQPIEPTTTLPNKPEPGKDTWIHVASQGSVAATLLDKNAQNRFNSGVTAREYLLQEQHLLAETDHKDTNGLFSPLPASIDEITPQQQALVNAHHPAQGTEEALPSLDSLNLPEPPSIQSLEEEAAWLGIDAQHPQAAYFNSILGQMPPQWREVLERELGVATPPLTTATAKPYHAPSTHPAAYPDELPDEEPTTPPPTNSVSTTPLPHMATGELSETVAHNAPLVVNPHALHPCLPDDMVAEIESTFSETIEETLPSTPLASAANIPTSHLAQFLAEGLDSTILPTFDVALTTATTTTPEDIPLLEHATIEQEWLETSTARILSENVIPFDFDIPSTTTQHVPPQTISSIPFITLDTMEHDDTPEMENLPKLEPSPQLAASAQLLHKVFDETPDIAMDTNVLETAQNQVLALQSQPASIQPNTTTENYFVVEQFSEHPEASTLLAEEPTTNINAPIDFPTFSFDLADLPTFETDATLSASTQATHLSIPTTTIPLNTTEDKTVVLQDALSTIEPPVNTPTPIPTLLEDFPEVATTPIALSPTQPSPSTPLETNWEALTQQLEQLNAPSTGTPQPVVANTVAQHHSIPATMPSAPTDPPLMNTTTTSNEQGSVQKLSVGLRIRHQEYGFGTVQAVVPLEDRNVASILFDTHGRKLLDPALSALYPA